MRGVPLLQCTSFALMGVVVSFFAFLWSDEDRVHEGAKAVRAVYFRFMREDVRSTPMLYRPRHTFVVS